MHFKIKYFMYILYLKNASQISLNIVLLLNSKIHKMTYFQKQLSI